MFEFLFISAILVFAFIICCIADVAMRKKEKAKIENFKARIVSDHLLFKDK